MGVWPRLRGIIKSDIRDKTPSYFGGLLCHHLPMGDDGVVSYLQVGERESERSHLDYKRKRERWILY